MWKKGELVWVSLNLSDKWIPGRILDPSEPFGVLVSFFGLMEERYVPKPCIRSFDRNFEALISDSWSFRKFVNRALRAHFWNISSGLWCSCQPPIDSPYYDRENSLPWFPRRSDSALGYVREMAISVKMPLRRLAETNSSSAQILSFRRYVVDFERSESVYEEIRESAKVMDQSEETGWYLDPLNSLECIDLAPMFPERVNSDVEDSGDPLPKDIHCCVSEKPIDKEIQVHAWHTRNPLTNSDSSILKACETMARRFDREDDGHLSKRRKTCQDEQTIVEDTTSLTGPRVAAVSGAPPDVMIEASDDIIGSDDKTVTSTEQLLPLLVASNDKAILAKPISFAVPGACKTLARSVKEAYANSRNKLNSSKIRAKTLEGESLEKNPYDGTRENYYDNALETHIGEVRQVSLHNNSTSVGEFSCDDIGIAPAKQSQDMDTTVGTAIAAVGNVRSIGIKRKASPDKVAAGNSKRKKKAGQQSISTGEPLNLHVLKDMRLAKPKCLGMKFLSRHGNLPSKAELLKRFSVFGKIDASKTDVNPEKSYAKVVFLQSIDAVTAYQFARSKKFTLGRSKVMFQLNPFEQDREINEAPMPQTPQKSVSSPASCLKKHGTPDKGKERRNLKVNFRMETTNS